MLNELTGKELNSSVGVLADVVHFIDFEYAGLNFQAYDLANHFNEFAGE